MHRLAACDREGRDGRQIPPAIDSDANFGVFG
jgi:hypothetical protein